jgi:hypothetical protein
MSQKLKWERVLEDGNDDQRDGSTWRASVEGGWLVRVSNGPNFGGLTFVPDSGHRWNVEIATRHVPRS